MAPSLYFEKKPKPTPKHFLMQWFHREVFLCSLWCLLKFEILNPVQRIFLGKKPKNKIRCFHPVSYYSSCVFSFFLKKVFSTWICYFFTTCQQSKLSLLIKNVVWFSVGEIQRSFMRKESWKEVEKGMERIRLEGGELVRKPLFNSNSIAPLL